MRTPETMTARQRAASLNINKSGGENLPASNMSNNNSPKLTPKEARIAEARASLARGSDSSSPTFDPMDEIDGSIIVLNVNEIDEYSLNPRTKENPRRQEIKESMRIDGITNIFSVTRRNPSEPYFPYGGGNTRVSLAKELVKEGVAKLQTIQVITRKWPGEAAVIAAHLSENDNRGDISFWERAQGVMNYKREIERASGKSHSAAELNNALKEQGLGYGIKMIQNFIFAAENMELIGPWLQAKDVNESIRPTVTALHEIGSKFDKRDEVKEAIEEIFLMHATDLDALELTNKETPPNSRIEVKLDVQGLLAQIQSVSSKHFGIDTDHFESVLQSYIQDPKLSADDLQSIAKDLKKAQLQPKQAPLSGMLAKASRAASTDTQTSPKAGQKAGVPTDKLAGYSARLMQNLLDLDKVIPLSDFIKPAPGLPYGFIADIPESMSKAGEHQISQEQEDLRIYLWPFLATQTGQCNANLISQCDPSSRWVQAIQSGIDVFRQQCTERNILCGKNGQIYVTSDHYGYLFSNADISRPLSGLMQTIAEFNVASPVSLAKAYKPLFSE